VSKRLQLPSQSEAAFSVHVRVWLDLGRFPCQFLLANFLLKMLVLLSRII
jgi:hypothetical protein